MPPVIKTPHKAEAEEAQRRYFWSLTPRERLVLAVRLNRQARALYAANPANPPRPAAVKRVIKSAGPVPRSRKRPT